MKIDTNEARKHLPPEAFALSPLDGRYHTTGEVFASYFSEYALMGYRFMVEMKWLIRFLQTIEEGEEAIGLLEELANQYNSEIYAVIKTYESKTNHDVKAVEYAIRDLLEKNGLGELQSYVHIGCTSEDINNLAYARMWKDAIRDVLEPAERKLIRKLAVMANEYRFTPMLSHTHGQPASPTTVGKELSNFVAQLSKPWECIDAIPISGKFNGATGNYSALVFAYPDYDWEAVAEKFVDKDINLDFEPYSTQIDPHDWNVEICTNLYHFALELKQIDTDIWFYISKNMFAQIPVKGEVGSSVMPHKVNPIRFENSEGQLKFLIGAIEGYCRGIKESRMQRDLSDSSLQRYSGELCGLLYHAIQQTISGLGRISPNKVVLDKQLNDNWAVLAEPIQTLLRARKVPDAYERLKNLTRGENITRVDIHEFIMDCDAFTDKDKERLLDLTPANYIGYAARLTNDVVNGWLD